jgi:hypothetical protein
MNLNRLWFGKRGVWQDQRQTEVLISRLCNFSEDFWRKSNWKLLFKKNILFTRGFPQLDEKSPVNTYIATDYAKTCK